MTTQNKKAPAYQWYPDKWLNDTRRLTWEAAGIYKALLDVIWMQFQDTCSIPDDDQYIASEIGCTNEQWITTKEQLLNPYRPLLTLTETNRLFNNGLWKEREKQCLRRERLAANGAKGGRPRNSEKQKVISDKPNDNLNERLPSLSPSLSLSPSSSTPTEEDTPPNPRKRGKRLTEAQKKRIRVTENTDQMIRIGSWFNRKPSSMWSIYEQEALDCINPSTSEIEQIESYYTANNIDPKKDYRRKNVGTLLNNWYGELDRAVAHSRMPTAAQTSGRTDFCDE